MTLIEIVALILFGALFLGFLAAWAFGSVEEVEPIPHHYPRREPDIDYWEKFVKAPWHTERPPGTRGVEICAVYNKLGEEADSLWQS